MGRHSAEEFQHREDGGHLEHRERTPEEKMAFMEDALMAANALVETLRAQLIVHEEATEKLLRELEMDRLTELPNERSLLSYEERRRENQHLEDAVAMFVDINHFKHINDTLGHAVGDEIVKQVSLYLKSITRADRDIVVRLHGDEFFIVFEGMKEDDVLKKFEHNKMIFDAAYGDGEKITVSLSAGITEYLPDELLETAMLRADEAMYESKDKRDGSISRFIARNAESRPEENDKIY
jgi:diguanylate cyclase (GGDEF)-like protein